MKLQTNLIFLLLKLIIIPSTKAVLSNFTNCSDSPNYTPNSPFQANLNNLLATLPFEASLTGFHNSSFGQNHDKAYVQYLCRGDTSSQNYCSQCINNAQLTILEQCPSKYWGAIWFDDCMLRFSNTPFLHEVDYDPSMVVENTQNVSHNITQLFDVKLRNIMKDLVPQVASNRVRFGTKEGDIDGTSKKLYALGQCTPDLTVDDCEQCLHKAVEQLPLMYGGRVLLPSCNVRFEFNQFYRNNYVNSSFFLPPNTNAKTNTIPTTPKTSLGAAATPSLNLRMIFVVAIFFNYLFSKFN